ncbi:MAG: DUF2442 domain-containing protein [Thermoguttaceae bacterium]
MLEVVNARHEGGYCVWVQFNDGESGVVDLFDALWGPMFDSLRDVEQFRRFAVSDVLHTLAWDNGADLAPEYLRDKLLHQKTASPTNG